MTQTIINLGTGGAVLNGQNGSTTSADSNDAQFLDWDGLNYVYLPGVASNFMSVPDEAALDITGDIDIRVQVALDDWTPGAATAFVSKFDAAGQRSFELGITSTDFLRLSLSTDGTAEIGRTATAALTVIDGEPLWVRVTLDADNGASGHDVKFFTSSDGIAFTQLGSTVTTAGTLTLHSGTSAVNIGSRTSSTRLASGKFYRAQIYSDLTETNKVLEVDTSVITSGSATSFTAVTGQTVTINRSTAGRKSVAVVNPVWLFGTDDYMEVADNALLDFGASDSFTILAVVRQWDTKTNNTVIIGKRNTAASTAAGWTLRNASNVAAIDIGDGTTRTTDTTSDAFVSGILYSLSATRGNASLTMFVNAASDGGTADTTGDLSSSLPVRMGRLSGASGSYADMELIAVSVFRRALTATEISQITAFYQARLS
jgi:hypothetical protein